MTTLPIGPIDWQYRHQNYARLLLKSGMRSNGKFCRDAINSVLDEVERIQGKNQRQMLSDFLNHEREAMASNIELVKPQIVIDQEAAYLQSQYGQESKDDKHEQHKRDIAASDEFMRELTA